MSRRILTSLTAVLLVAAIAPAALAGSSPSQEAAIAAWLKAWNTGGGDLESFLTDDFKFRGPFRSSDDVQGFRETLTTGRNVFPDARMTVGEPIRDGDRAALPWQVTGTHHELGRTVVVEGISLLVFRGGRIAEERRMYDGGHLLKQLGATLVWPETGGDGGRASD